MIEDALHSYQPAGRDKLYVAEAVEIARSKGLLPETTDVDYTTHSSGHQATGNDLWNLLQWQVELNNQSHNTNNNADEGDPGMDRDDGAGVDQSNVTGLLFPPTPYFRTRNVPQLLMQIQGEGGTGKSKVIQTVTDFFLQRGLKDSLLKGAYTGIAASLIDGKTTHALASIPRKSKAMSEFDECSMFSKAFFALLSRNISIAKGDDTTDKPFGGVNVILCGDFHQFPPIIGSSKVALYHPAEPARESAEECLGRFIYPTLGSCPRSGMVGLPSAPSSRRGRQRRLADA